MEDLLIQAGLTKTQAHLYIHLLDQGQSTPPDIAKLLGLTRSNAYKVLERLEELGLVQKIQLHKKITYQAADPAALASLAAEERNRTIAVEQTVNDVMQQLRIKYRKGTKESRVTTGRGKQAILEAYEQQAAKKESIHYVKTRSDIPFMGFEAMHRIRMLPVRSDTPRFGITPNAPEVSNDPNGDKRSNLIRTLIPFDSYTAAVEWTATKDELLILVFENEGYYIRIQDKAVAEAFNQLWSLLDTNIRQNSSIDGAYGKN